MKLKREVNEMKSLVLLLLSILFGMNVMAAPGGGHHKITTYDYHDYLNSSIQSKTFIRHEQDIDLNLAWYFDRPKPDEAVITEITTDADGNITRQVENSYKRTTRTFDWVQTKSYDTNVTPPSLFDTVDITPAAVILTDDMVPGIAWGSAGASNSSHSGESYYTDMGEVLAVEDVTVTAGTFRDCLKVHRLRGSGSYPFTRIEWYCPDMGLVKRIDGGRRMLEMTSVTFD